MDCNKAHELYDTFMGRKLNGRTLRDFLKHIDTCDKCREDLEIHCLVHTVNEMLDGTSLTNYNLKTHLSDLINAEKKRCRMMDRFMFLVTIAGIILIGLIVYGFFFR